MARQSQIVGVQLNDADYKRIRLALKSTPRDVDKLIRNAINRTTGTGAALIRDAVFKRLNITRKAIAESIFRSKVRLNTLVGEIVISKNPISLISFNPTQTKRGVRVRLFRDKSPEIFRHAFITELPVMNSDFTTPERNGRNRRTQVAERAGHLPTRGPHAGGKRTQWVQPRRRKDRHGKWTYGPFKRYRTTTKIKLTKRGYAGSFAVDKKYGPSVLGILGTQGTTAIAREALKNIQATLQKNIDSQIRYFLSGRKNLTDAQREAI